MTVMFQFGYCPLFWINYSRTLNNGINGLYKRALSLVYNDFSSTFSELLEKDKSVNIHHRYLQTLRYEIFKVKNNMATEILTELFPKRESNYSLRNSTTLHGTSIKTVMYGSETISSLGPKIRDILPTELKTLSPTLLKKKIRERPQRIVYVVYVKCTYKILDFCKLRVRTYFVL